MAITKYGVIEIGAYEVEVKIYQILPEKKIQEVETLRRIMGLGVETYSKGRISFENIEKLCDVLENFKQVLEAYKVKDFSVVATSGIRDAENSSVILDRIKIKTGMDVQLLSNSEERFYDYMALSLFDEEREKFMMNGAAYIDLGSGSMQVSLVENGSLVATQQLMLGSIRVREQLYGLSDDMRHFNLLIDELVNNDWQTFKKMILKDKEIKCIVATGVHITRFVKKINGGRKNNIYSIQEFNEILSNCKSKTAVEMASEYNMTEEQAIMLVPTIRIYQKIINETGAKVIWIPCTELTDGVVVNYGLSKRKIMVTHNYNDDILSTAKSISKRYKASQSHINHIRDIATAIFDATKKVHGMGARERLLLEIAVQLHDCGKYISITASAQCSYDIIMATEIIGLSHKERAMVANIVRLNRMSVKNSDDLTIVKLVAMLRMANALDRSHRQKFKNHRVEFKDNVLVISVITNEDITLERGTFKEKAEFFEEVMGVKPILKQRKEV